MSLFSLEGKTALITGGTRGIGASMTLALANAGASIVLVQRNKGNLDTYNAVLAIPRPCSIVICDLANAAEVKGLTALVTGKKENGGMEIEIDILLNCGGIQRRNLAENFTDADWDEVIQVNLTTVFTLSRDIGRHMLASRGGVAGEEVPTTVNPRGRGKIISVGSLLSFQGAHGVPAYVSAKHGVLGMTRALSNEWSSKGINVNQISPGYIQTEFTEALHSDPVKHEAINCRIPFGRWGQVTDLDGVVVFLASPSSDYICGTSIMVDGGFIAR